jgi:hypothetical protein
MARKSKGKKDQEPEEANYTERVQGIEEVSGTDQGEDAAKDAAQEDEDLTMFQKFWKKVSEIPPLRLGLFLMMIVYLIKNYINQPADYVAPSLPADHEERMAEQRAKNVEKYWMYGKYICVSGALYFTMRYINMRAETKLEEKKASEVTKAKEK